MQIGSFDKKLALFLSYLVILMVMAMLLLMFRQPSKNIVQQDLSYASPAYNLAESGEYVELDRVVESKVQTVDIKSITSHCEEVHIAIVCGGFNSTRNLYVLLKSILFYRTDAIHLHLFVDYVSQTILKELFSTWQVLNLNVNYYNITKYEDQISWITSPHYSHRYGLMKLVFLSVLMENKNLSKVILLDTDMLVLGNLNRLWREFGNFYKSSTKVKPVFGMVENQSDWYLGNSRLSSTHVVWPAIGRGFNSGLILVDLSELKNQKWRQTWHDVAESELVSQLSTSLADQDIFNAVIRSHSYMIHVLPCFYNLQLNDHTKLDEVCPDMSSNFRIIHWNSPYKFMSKNPKAEYFRNWYLTFRNWDGNLLKQSYCNQTLYATKVEQESKLEPITEKFCKDIQPRPQDKLRTFLYFLEFEMEQSAFDVTFVVHLSLDRLQVLDQLAMHWLGPISVAIYLSELETNLLLTSIESSNNLYRRKNIGYHLVYRDHGFNYPINRLRNIALNNALTPYVFLSDIDFLPSIDLYEYLKRTISDLSPHGNGDPLNKRALVVPAFENLQYKFDFPSSKAELLQHLNLGSISMFRDQIWPQGHSPTDYSKWKISTKSYKVDWKPEYEPFIVTSKSVPRFDERFVGFGWNKVEHTMQLAALNYEFVVLPEAFVIHKFHSASYDIMKHRESLKYRACIRQLRRTFLLELRANFSEFFNNINKVVSRSTTE